MRPQLKKIFSIKHLEVFSFERQVFGKQQLRQKKRKGISASLFRALNSPVATSSPWWGDGAEELHKLRRNTLCQSRKRKLAWGWHHLSLTAFTVDHSCLCQLLSVCVGLPRITAMIFTLQQLPSWDLRMLHKCRLGLPKFLPSLSIKNSSLF